VFLVGGGNSAGQAVLHLSRVAKIVTTVVRGDSLKATLSSYLIDRIRSTPNIEVLTNTEVVALEGDSLLRAITLQNRLTGEKKIFRTRWLFVCIGGLPHTDWALEGV
jgi:thioredoxin reductase (NADPH)